MLQSATVVMDDLQAAVTRLAAPAARQLDYLADLGVLPSVDELALEFDDRFVLVPELEAARLLTAEQVEALRRIDRLLVAMSQQPDRWTATALAEHPDWAELRRLAAVSLRTLGAPEPRDSGQDRAGA